MRKIFFSLLTVFLLPAVSADDFEDFEQAAAVVAANSTARWILTGRVLRTVTDSM